MGGRGKNVAVLKRGQYLSCPSREYAVKYCPLRHG